MRRLHFISAMLCVLSTVIVACSQHEVEPGAVDKYTRAVQALSDEDYDLAYNLFTDLAAVEGYGCDADFGRSLAKVHELLDEVNFRLATVVFPLLEDSDIVSLASLHGTEGDYRTQVDFSGQLAAFVAPWDRIMEDITDYAARAVEGGCELHLPEGLPLTLSAEGQPLYVHANLGYTFGEAFARLLVTEFAAVRAMMAYALAYRWDFGERQVFDALDLVQATAEQAAQDVTGTTWVSIARAAGGLAEANPRLFELRDPDQLTQASTLAATAARALYERDSEGESGLLPAMLAHSDPGDEPGTRVLAIEDTDGSGTLTGGDVLRFGLRALHTNTVRLPHLSGVQVVVPSSCCDFAEAADSVHELIQVVGDQLAAVASPETEWRRLDLSEVNRFLESMADFPYLTLPQNIPEAVELDLRAYWDQPVGLRQLFPYWYDDDGDPETFAVFAVEGESSSPTIEPYVWHGDVAHFPSAITFAALEGETPAEIALRIPDDGIAPNNRVLLPLPYVAWQDPSFHGVVYVDPSRFENGSETPADFSPATQYSLNKVVNQYILWFVDSMNTTVGPLP